MSPTDDRADVDQLTDADWQRLDRYTSGEGSAAERAVLEAWIESHAVLRVLAQSMRDTGEYARRPRREWNAEAGWLAASARAGIDSDVLRTSSTRVRRERDAALPLAVPRGARDWRSPAWSPPRWHRGWSVGAAFLLGIGVAVGYASLRIARRPTAGHQYATIAGQRLALTLSDGTTLTLGPASRLRVPDDYAAGHRVVRVDGEALFAVVHDTRHPFTVHARDVVATDVGTRFDVRAYVGDTTVRVAVVEGAVDLETPRRAAGRRPLRVRDLAIVSDSGVAISHNVDVGTLTAWARGELVFRGTPLRDVATELARWYDLDVVVAEPALNALPLTATFADEPLPQVLHVVAASLGLRVDRAGRSVRFLPLH